MDCQHKNPLNSCKQMVEIQKNWNFYFYRNIVYGLKPIVIPNSLVSPIDSDDIREW